ncbi:MAG: 50S ribosomal protein L17 [Bacteroidales bacterium]
MRHRKSINHLGRKSAHREAMLSNMAASLIMHKRINTTLAKAKALRSYVEPLITRSKEDTTHNRRMVFSYLQNKEAVTELFRAVSQKIADRPGGYTRILKTGSREGDNADMCLIELVDYNETYLKDVKAGGDKGKTRRSRSKKKAETSEETPVKAKAPAKAVSKPDPEPEVAEETPETVTEELAQVTAEETTEVVDETPSEEIPETPAEEKEKEV